MSLFIHFLLESFLSCPPPFEWPQTDKPEVAVGWNLWKLFCWSCPGTRKSKEQGGQGSRPHSSRGLRMHKKWRKAALYPSKAEVGQGESCSLVPGGVQRTSRPGWTQKGSWCGWGWVSCEARQDFKMPLDLMVQAFSKCVELNSNVLVQVFNPNFREVEAYLCEFKTSPST